MVSPSDEQLRQLALKRNEHMNEIESKHARTYEGWDQYVVIPDNKLEYLHDMLIQKHEHVMLRGPPSCGKTTIAFTFSKYLQKKGIDVFSVSCIHLSKHTIDDFFHNQTFTTWSDVLKWNRDAIVIIDEAQLLYSNEYKQFWVDVKSAPRNISIFFLSAYSYGFAEMDVSTRFEVKKLYFSFLKIEMSCFQQIIRMHIENFTFLQHITDDIWDMAYHDTGGHACLLRATLNFLIEEFKKLGHGQGKPLVPNHVCQTAANLLKSQSYISTICSLRTLTYLKGMQPSKYSLLQSALYKCDEELVFSLADDNKPDFAILQRLIKIGVIQSVETPNHYQFTAPLVYDAVYRSFMSGSDVIENPTSDADFQHFLLCVLTNINPHRLIGSCHFQGRKTGNVDEDFWQKEFYRSMAKQLSGKLSISTNVGRKFKEKQWSTRVGFMDFYINHNVKWGFELVCGGKNLQERISRFLEGGRYHHYDFNKWVVIDFRKSNPIAIKENVCYAVYNQDYSELCVTYKTMHRIVVKVTGSE